MQNRLFRSAQLNLAALTLSIVLQLPARSIEGVMNSYINIIVRQLRRRIASRNQLAARHNDVDGDLVGVDGVMIMRRFDNYTATDNPVIEVIELLRIVINLLLNSA